jgi:hypothetical protein
MGSTLHAAARRKIMNSRDLLSVVDFDQLVEVKNAIRNVETAVVQVAVELNKLLAKSEIKRAKVKKERKAWTKKTAPVISQAPAEVSASVN